PPYPIPTPATSRGWPRSLSRRCQGGASGFPPSAPNGGETRFAERSSGIRGRLGAAEEAACTRGGDGWRPVWAWGPSRSLRSDAARDVTPIGPGTPLIREEFGVEEGKEGRRGRLRRDEARMCGRRHLGKASALSAVAASPRRGRRA